VGHPQAVMGRDCLHYLVFHDSHRLLCHYCVHHAEPSCPILLPICMPPVGLDCFQSNQECLKHHFHAGLHVLPDAISHLHGLDKLHQHPLREMELPHTII
jgi:hypothetical protein